ncbi:MAG: NUDIX domain-containing protein [Candidatus Gracilibacteria bacterium]|jgi:ADP-ribose pyrophosphatase YjhB (NUDIX family)|nr:NUDIX domain-containing protein [Candidatus Gracilibacteria bacterium]
MEYWKFIREKVGKEKVLFNGSVGAILEEGKVLLVFDKGRSQWQMPGGLQELGESVEETALREISEELNLKAQIKDLIAVYSDPKWSFTYPNGDSLQVVSFCFLLKVKEEEYEKIKIDESENSEFKWFNISELPKNTDKQTLQMCKDLQEFSGKTFLR